MPRSGFGSNACAKGAEAQEGGMALTMFTRNFMLLIPCLCKHILDIILHIRNVTQTRRSRLFAPYLSNSYSLSSEPTRQVLQSLCSISSSRIERMFMSIATSLSPILRAHKPSHVALQVQTQDIFKAGWATWRAWFILNTKGPISSTIVVLVGFLI